VRDETLGEDRCQVHTGTTPQVLAALRNGIPELAPYHGVGSNIAEANRRYSPTRKKRCIYWGGFTTMKSPCETTATSLPYNCDFCQPGVLVVTKTAFPAHLPASGRQLTHPCRCLARCR